MEWKTMRVVGLHGMFRMNVYPGQLLVLIWTSAHASATRRFWVVIHRLAGTGTIGDVLICLSG
jgi:hypothetical protein